MIKIVFIACAVIAMMLMDTLIKSAPDLIDLITATIGGGAFWLAGRYFEKIVGGKTIIDHLSERITSK